MTYDEFLKEAGGLLEMDWRRYRRQAARRNLQQRLRELGVDGYDAYLKLIREDPSEAHNLPDLLRVTVSRFFREKNCWQDLAKAVLPVLAAAREPHDTLRAWSAGCCCGEEPYSLALIWDFGCFPAAEQDSVKQTGSLSKSWEGDLDLLATDIDDDVLERARDGCYQNSSMREAPAEFIGRYFERRGGRECIVRSIADVVRFERHNLMEDPLPQGMDLVLCRYLPFTYYRGSRLTRALERLAGSIKAGGALMIGRKEGLGPNGLEFFDPWPGAETVFRRKPRNGGIAG